MQRENGGARLVGLLVQAVMWSQSLAVYCVGTVLSWFSSRRAAGTGPNPAEVRRLLLIRTDELGDLVMSTPLLREVRRLFPRAHITLVVKAGLQNFVEACPHINEIIRYNAEVP